MNIILHQFFIAVFFICSIDFTIRLSLHTLEIKKKSYKQTKEGKEEYWRDCRKGFWLCVKAVASFLFFIINTKTYILLELAK